MTTTADTQDQQYQRRPGFEDQNPPPPVILTNGAEEYDPLVSLTMLALRRLMDEGHGIAVYELRELCRDRHHKLFGNAADVLEPLTMINVDTNGKPHVHFSIRNIVLSAVTGEGLDMTLENPIAKGRHPMTTTAIPPATELIGPTQEVQPLPAPAPLADRYLGDGVYASYDGYHIILDLRKQNATTRIALNQNVLASLNKFAAEIGDALAAQTGVPA